MTFTGTYNGREKEITDLFATTFGASEGDDEGAAIGDLVRNLMADTPDGDLYLFATQENDTLSAALFMSRLSFPQDKQVVFMMAPVAVLPAHQGKGVGQTLIRHTLEEMRTSGTDVAVTYGDPAYYSRFGFGPVSPDALAPPVPLQFPHGWQALRLTASGEVAVKGPSTCVSAFANPAYW